jgi:hypothetical protein
MNDPRPVDPSSQPRQRWTVRRQDDSGNRFVVQSGLSHEDAERLVAQFEEKGHKQFYWADPDTT